MSAGPEYTILNVSRRTGLSPHVIRVWERRHGAVRPRRSDTNRRLYSESDVHRLSLLARLSAAGNPIGRIASLSTDELGQLAARAGAVILQSAAGGRQGESPEELLEESLRAVEALDAPALDHAIARASIRLSRPVLLEQLVLPLMKEVGERWRHGSLRAAHEHMATALLRTALGQLARSDRVSASGPLLLAATPQGQAHELGALVAAAAAVTEGWRVTYLGPCLPAEDMAAAALQSGARVLALSIVYPTDDPRLFEELALLGRLLPTATALAAGGPAAAAYRTALENAGARLLPDVSSFRSFLASLRGGAE